MTPTQAAKIIREYLTDSIDPAGKYRELEFTTDSSSLLGRSFSVMKAAEDSLTPRSYARILRIALEGSS